MFNYINPSFNIFGLEIHWYAICILVGVIIAVWAGIKEGRKIGLSSDFIYTGVVIVLPCAILGARLWWDLFNIDKIHSFSDIFAVWDGGLAIQGGVLGALVTVFIYCRVKKVSFYKTLDVVAPGFLIGQICGRWGNFCNHELYGPVIENVSIFKTLLPSFITENMFINGAYRHPVFLYESLLNLVGLITILLLRKKFKKLESGDLIGFYLIWYGIVRIPIELLRSQSGANEILMAGPIPMSILISFIFIVCGITFLICKRLFGQRVNYLELKKEIEENRYDTILFDLDGTLLNTRELIDKSFVHTFEHFYPELVSSNEIYEMLDSFFGPSLKQTFSRFTDDGEKIQEMIKYYRDYNVSIHDDCVKAFPNAKSLIKTLAKKGYKLGIVSSKKTDLVEHGLELFGMLQYIRVVIGEDEVKIPKPDPEGILKAMEILHSKKALYIGDGIGDIKAGKNANIDTIGVLYSERKEQIKAENPTYTINDLSEVLNILME